ncbi:NUDIX domain-containing protein [Streptomyces bobili]|uniref:NUDIX domain-containing protein n=1 Tax=Streptomyces bobili TaxID=67280 RepID=UPI0033FA3209
MGRRGSGTSPNEVRRPASPHGTVLNVIGGHLYLERPDATVLLGPRHPGSAFAPSTWHVLAGHCEQESAITRLIREAREEAGLQIRSQDVELVHVGPGAPRRERGPARSGRQRAPWPRAGRPSPRRRPVVRAAYAAAPGQAGTKASSGASSRTNPLSSRTRTVTRSVRRW